ncbi:MAG: glycosyltransferase family 88 protein [Tatlockia sp.]|jgi:glucosyltransferase Lgt1/2/3
MPYLFNPHRHVKIWISTNSSVFLNLVNQLRLVRIRAINPHDQIHLIYDALLLTPKAVQELSIFCNKHNIIFLDVHSEIFPHCHSIEEHHLIKVYQDEMCHLNEGGNVAVGSDILRWLKPVYTLGTYSDFDTTVDTRKLPDTVAVNGAFLLNIGSVQQSTPTFYESVTVTNDLFAVVSPDNAEPLIKQIQTAMYNACTRPIAQFRIYSNLWKANIQADFPDFMKPFSDNLIPFLAPLRRLGRINQGQVRTARELRAKILEQTKDNTIFCNAREKNLQTLAATIREDNPTSPLIALSDEELITTVREQARHENLKNTVTFTTGPDLLNTQVFTQFIYPNAETIENERAPNAFVSYGLDKAFRSFQSVPFHATLEQMKCLRTNTLVEKNDCSWLKKGQDAIALREVKIKAATRCLQRFFKQHKNKKEVVIEPFQPSL